MNISDKQTNCQAQKENNLYISSWDIHQKLTIQSAFHNPQSRNDENWLKDADKLYTSLEVIVKFKYFDFNIRQFKLDIVTKKPKEFFSCENNRKHFNYLILHFKLSHLGILGDKVIKELNDLLKVNGYFSYYKSKNHKIQVSQLRSIGFKAYFFNLDECFGKGGGKKKTRDFDPVKEAAKFKNGEQLLKMYNSNMLKFPYIDDKAISFELKYKNMCFVEFVGLILKAEIKRDKGIKVAYKNNRYYADKLKCSIGTVIRMKKTLMLFGVEFEETKNSKGKYKNYQGEDKIIVKDISVLWHLEKCLCKQHDIKIVIHKETSRASQICYTLCINTNSLYESIKKKSKKIYFEVKELFVDWRDKLIKAGIEASGGVFNGLQVNRLVSSFSAILKNENRLVTKLDVFIKRFTNYIVAKAKAQKKCNKYGNYEIKEIREHYIDTIERKIDFIRAEIKRNLDNPTERKIDKVLSIVRHRIDSIKSFNHFVKYSCRVAFKLRGA